MGNIEHREYIMKDVQCTSFIIYIYIVHAAPQQLKRIDIDIVSIHRICIDVFVIEFHLKTEDKLLQFQLVQT